MNYSEKLKSPKWQQRRLEVLKRDKFTCRDCGATDKTLHVHHCFYEKGEPWDTKLDFLMTLCWECHESRGELESDGKRALGYIFSRMGNRPDDVQLKEFIEQLTSASDWASGPVLVEHDRLYALWCAAGGPK